MKPQQFPDILQSIPMMSPEQICVLHKTLPSSLTTGDAGSVSTDSGSAVKSQKRTLSVSLDTSLAPRKQEKIESSTISENKAGDAQGISGEPRLLEGLKFYFDRQPACPHCGSEAVKRWETHTGHQRYQCKQCLHTFNVMTKLPLAHLRVRDKPDQCLECMDGSPTLRPAAAKCGVSLNASFHLRHRLMVVVKEDFCGLLSGILEEDETFFLESDKRTRNLERRPRKRGGRRLRNKHPSEAKKSQSEPVKPIPVVEACDRDHHVYAGFSDCWKNTMRY